MLICTHTPEREREKGINRIKKEIPSLRLFFIKERDILFACFSNHRCSARSRSTTQSLSKETAINQKRENNKSENRRKEEIVGDNQTEKYNLKERKREREIENLQ
jgi:hypothetical protein